MAKHPVTNGEFVKFIDEDKVGVLNASIRHFIDGLETNKVLSSTCLTQEQIATFVTVRIIVELLLLIAEIHLILD